MAGVSEQLRQWWGRMRTRDPYWDDFLHRPPADPRNVITPAILPGPSGSVFPNRTDIHDPAAMSGHIKELARFFGVDVTGVSAVRGQSHPFAISCLVEAVEEVKPVSGVGGQFAVQKCATANFNIAAYIRELGYHADVVTEGADAYAAAAGLGALDPDGRLVSRSFGRRAGIAGAILTDLPLVPDKAAP